jgi:aspartyl-tRNA synthetase
MVAGFDRYFQIVKCFRDEDLRADRQPEFTQIDCEMAFVEREDILNTFEGLAKHLFKAILGKEFSEDFPRMSYDDAMRFYGCDKPDLRFGMKFHELNDLVQGVGFKVFDDAELVVGIKAEGCAGWSRKQTDALIDFVKRPQIGATGIVFLKWTEEGLKSTVDKFYTLEYLQKWAERFSMQQGDLMCIMAGGADKTRKQLNELRLHMGETCSASRDPWTFKPLWVVDFPLLEKDEESGRWHAMHHPFTSPIPEHAHLLESDPGAVKANAYDLVINGTEIGGGSIRIHDRSMQEAMFRVLGFTDEDARYKFGFLLDAFEYGAPPHGGAAFGFDRWVSLFGGRSDIREFIAFPEEQRRPGRDDRCSEPDRRYPVEGAGDRGEGLSRLLRPSVESKSSFQLSWSVLNGSVKVLGHQLLALCLGNTLLGEWVTAEEAEGSSGTVIQLSDSKEFKQFHHALGVHSCSAQTVRYHVASASVSRLRE